MLLITIKVSKCKLGPFEYAQSISKQPTKLVYIGNIISYLFFLPDPFPRGLKVDLEGSSTFPTLTLLIHINRLGLFSHLYGYLFNCVTICQGSWVGTIALHVEVGWHYTVAVLAWCNVHWLPECECVKVATLMASSCVGCCRCPVLCKPCTHTPWQHMGAAQVHITRL